MNYITDAFIAVVVALLLFILTGCSTPTVVQVPVLQKCQSAEPTKPELYYKPGSYTRVFDIVKDLKADHELLLGYSIELEAAAKACR